MKLLHKIFIASAFLALVACETDFDNKVTDEGFYNSGSADVSAFVAVGNSLTAGYADNALYKTGQENSFPNILASRFAFVGGGEFKQPMMADNYGGLLLGGNKIAEPRMVLSFDADGNAAPTVLDKTPTTEVSDHLSGTFNNLGVPGAKSFHLAAPGYGNVAGVATGQANPYFARFASSENATVIQDAVAVDATFFSLWIGNNDILSYATSGGVGEDQTGNMDPTTYGGNDITDPMVFASVYSGLLEGLTANGAKGVVANIPDVTTIPYFTTVPYNAVPMDEATAAMVNANFELYNDQVLPLMVGAGVISPEEAALREIEFSAGQNAPIIVDKDLTNLTDILISQGIDPTTAHLVGQLRQANAEDLLLLPSSSVIGTLADPSNPMSIMGVAVPLPDEIVLTKKEQVLVHTAMVSYNATIQALASQHELAFVDANALLRQLADGGLSYDAGMLTSDYVTGGAFSLDGVHPTARGYAFIANEMVKAIESTYGADLPKVNIGEFPTIMPHNN
ncbi:MAG TPA: hypothetical protein VK050_08875 [Flavobacteriaceae bacterium]|nr:hypothetical protein [Flavobacteriaceae bacterium]